MKLKRRIVRVTSNDAGVVCERCVGADTPWRRLRGLLGRRDLPAGDGILLRPTSSIHTFFMRFAIDAVFVDGDGLVLRVAKNLRPWRMAWERGAQAVLEIAAGECRRRGVRVGDRLELHRTSERLEPADA